MHSQIQSRFQIKKNTPESHIKREKTFCTSFFCYASDCILSTTSIPSSPFHRGEMSYIDSSFWIYFSLISGTDIWISNLKYFCCYMLKISQSGTKSQVCIIQWGSNPIQKNNCTRDVLAILCYTTRQVKYFLFRKLIRNKAIQTQMPDSSQHIDWTIKKAQGQCEMSDVTS